MLRIGLRTYVVPDSRRMLVLLLVLPMFGQVFHYVVDVPPAYYVSKLWPAAAAPFAVYALLRGEPAYRGFYLGLLGWVCTVPLLMSILYFHQPFLSALATLAKSLPISYALSLTGLLLWLKPTPAQLERAFVWLGGLTFVLMTVLWVVMPLDAYRSDSGTVTKLFLWEQDRGYRIYMPMFFGVTFMFYQFRRGLEGRWLSFLVFGVCFALLFLIYKQRVTIAAVLLVALFAAFRWNRLWRLVMLGGGAVGLVALVPLLAGLSHVGDEATASLGGSLSVRQETVRIAFEFLNQSVWRWLLGVGTLASVGDTTLQEYLHAPMFYLADIGWLGITFEYGLAGAVLLTGLYAVPLVARAELTGPKPGRFIDALDDYMIFLVLASSVYSVMYVPGEAATIFAIYAYVAVRRRAETGAAGTSAVAFTAPVPGLPRALR